MDGQYWKGDRTMSTNEWLLTSDFWQFIEPWHGRWYENEIFIASCTDNVCDLENERWLLGDMIDHVGIYGSGVAEGLSAFSVGLVITPVTLEQIMLIFHSRKSIWKCLHVGSHFLQASTVADSRLVPSQWETSLQSNAVSHWLGANLESALHTILFMVKATRCVGSFCECAQPMRDDFTL